FSDQVVVVDTQISPRAGKILKSLICEKIRKPVHSVFLTHHHGDHCGGNSEFVRDTPIFGTETIKTMMLERADDRVEYARTFGLVFQEAHPVVPPTQVVSADHQVSMGQETLRVIDLGSTETDDAVVICCPERSVACVGDSVATIDFPFLGTPFLDEGLRPDGVWIRALETLRKLRLEVLIPGHGPALVGNETIDTRLSLLIDLFQSLTDVTTRLYQRGLSHAEIVPRAVQELKQFRNHPGLRENTLSLDFAVYRILNGLIPYQKGIGWWGNLRKNLDPQSFWKSEFAETDFSWSKLSELSFLEGARTKPKVAATEFLAFSYNSAQRALQENAADPVAALNSACIEAFGCIVLCQNPEIPYLKLKKVLESKNLSWIQKKRAQFFKAKLVQYGNQVSSARDQATKKEFQELLGPWFSWSLPLVKRKLEELM
ncbi:MAG: MBL fold metallo-hydrolase, partial [Bdellovibrionales bacterium]|nr:MBL fold metallo-hydrolase [Bdellovibrionales bacterium]